MMEIHSYRSTWFVVATTNNKRFKKNNFDNFRLNYELGLFVAGGDKSGQQKQGANREIDAIFPILRTFLP
jgi:hypothetical protein